MEFKEFPKIYRVSRPCIITEKIDGTNSSICITEDGQFLAGSRTRWITPQDDNFGFSKWAHENKEKLMGLGVGHHFGEWWGQGIQRNYGLKERRFSLFNVSRWCLHGCEPKKIPQADPRIEKYQDILPECCSLVPILYEGIFSTEVISCMITELREKGSRAVPGWSKPEGLVCFHIQGNFGLKKTLEKDEEHKSMKGK